MRKRFSLFVVLAVALLHAHAQNVGGQTGSTTPDPTCTDPLSSNCNQQANSYNQGLGSQATGMPSAGQPRLDPSQAGSQAGSQSEAARQFTAPAYRDETALPNQSQQPRPGFESIPPESLTEFQKFVAQTTGQVLPIFGARLFQQVPTTFSPVDQIPIPTDAVVGPGDLLRVRIWGQVNFSADLRVDRSGEIYIPQVGPVHVASLRYADLNAELRTAISRVYRNFNVAVELGQIRSIQVYVVGRARRPGTYTVSSLSSLIDALFSSGGPSLDGSLRHIQLKRGGQLVADLDLYDLLVNGDKSHDTRLEPGDVIYIPAVGPQVALVGSVRTPAIYELKADTAVETVGSVIQQAAGMTNVAGGAELALERMQPTAGRAAEKISLDPAGLATPVRDGDILRVQPRVPQYAKTVTLRGNTANAGRYSWHAGMRLSELIPERQALLTRDYWWQRANAGLPAPEFLRYGNLDTMHQQADAKALPSQQEQAAHQRALELYKADYLRRRQENPASQERYDAVNGPRPYEVAALRDIQDVPAVVADPNLDRDSDASARQSALTQNTANARELTRVTLPAPEIDWRYAVVERLDPDTLKTSLIPFDLGKVVLDHDSSQDLELLSGDVVTIFSQADIHVPQDQQTHYIRLEGEFTHAGVYSSRPGETLKDLVLRAGGLSPAAYLFGSEFDRVSVRAVQQRRLDAYIQKLQLQVERGILATSSAVSSSAANLASANAAGAEARELITRLQQVKASGRIVLDLRTFSNRAENLPPLQLEDGDTFYVPSVPSSVSVIGAVYDQNSFVFKPGNRVLDYVKLAGGANRDADKSHPYVIRADGSVLSQAELGENKFRKIIIQPGDTIVIAEKTFGPSRLRDFLNFSQLFAQLAVGGALVSKL